MQFGWSPRRFRAGGPLWRWSGSSLPVLARLQDWTFELCIRQLHVLRFPTHRFHPPISRGPRSPTTMSYPWFIGSSTRWNCAPTYVLNNIIFSSLMMSSLLVQQASDRTASLAGTMSSLPVQNYYLSITRSWETWQTEDSGVSYMKWATDDIGAYCCFLLSAEISASVAFLTFWQDMLAQMIAVGHELRWNCISFSFCFSH